MSNGHLPLCLLYLGVRAADCRPYPLFRGGPCIGIRRRILRVVASYTTLEKAGPARTTQGGYQSEFAAEGLRMQMPQRLRAKSISRSPATERPPRVLIIDDDEAVATHVRDIVRDANFGPMNEIPDVFYVT